MHLSAQVFERASDDVDIQYLTIVGDTLIVDVYGSDKYFFMDMSGANQKEVNARAHRNTLPCCRASGNSLTNYEPPPNSFSLRPSR